MLACNIHRMYITVWRNVSEVNFFLFWLYFFAMWHVLVIWVMTFWLAYVLVLFWKWCTCEWLVGCVFVCLPGCHIHKISNCEGGWGNCEGEWSCCSYHFHLRWHPMHSCYACHLRWWKGSGVKTSLILLPRNGQARILVLLPTTWFRAKSINWIF